MVISGRLIVHAPVPLLCLPFAPIAVKEFPKALLLNALPDNVNILCTHPMFGPDSEKQVTHTICFHIIGNLETMHD